MTGYLPRGYREKRICEWCGREFILLGYRIRSGRKGRFCSHECCYAYLMEKGHNFIRISRNERRKFNYTCLLCNVQKSSYKIVCHEEGVGKTAELFILCRHCHSTIEMIKRGNIELYNKILDLLRNRKVYILERLNYN